MSSDEYLLGFRSYPPLEPVYPFDPFKPLDPKRRRPMPKRPFEVNLEMALKGTNRIIRKRR